MAERLPGGRFGGTIRTSRHTPKVWRVPPHLRGLACQICGHFFQDGETHGELSFETGEMTCRSRVLQITNRPSLALVLAPRLLMANVRVRLGTPGQDIAQ